MATKCANLYLVATPVGNLEDITLRALRILKEVDLIAAEDTRRTLKLLNYYQIKKKMCSYHKYNERDQSKMLISQLESGVNVALVSDAGMPGISDPGNQLVSEAIVKGISVIPIPGASAVITALAASGLNTGSFLFTGFLPRKKQAQVVYLKTLAEFTGTLVVYEAPQRVLATLQNILETFGNRQAVVARELTKVHEQFLRGELKFLINEVSLQEMRGEITILVSGAAENNLQNSTNIDIQTAFLELNHSETTLKDELRIVAKKTGKSLKEVYRLYLENKKNEKKDKTE